MTTLFQTGILPGFLKGIYDGDCTLETLHKKGDIGLGTFNALAGEMVAVDGVFYQIDGQGKAHIASSSICTPFALVSHFQRVKGFQIKNIKNLSALNALLDSHLCTPNIFYMIRIDGEMQHLQLRSETCQHHPYPLLSAALAQSQHAFELASSKGTLVVTYCPAYLSSVTIPGYHYHYIDEQKATGGHVFDLQIKSALVIINPIRNFELALQNTPVFDQTSMDIDIQAEIKKVE